MDDTQKSSTFRSHSASARARCLNQCGDHGESKAFSQEACPTWDVPSAYTKSSLGEFKAQKNSTAAAPRPRSTPVLLAVLHGAALSTQRASEHGHKRT